MYFMEWLEVEYNVLEVKGYMSIGDSFINTFSNKALILFHQSV